MEEVKTISVIALEDMIYNTHEIKKGEEFEILPDDFKGYLDNQMIILRGGVK